jgi:hypothetical protein
VHPPSKTIFFDRCRFLTTGPLGFLSNGSTDAVDPTPLLNTRVTTPSGAGAFLSGERIDIFTVFLIIALYDFDAKS